MSITGQFRAAADAQAAPLIQINANSTPVVYYSGR